MTDKGKIRAEIERRYNEYMAKDSELAAIRADECLGILSYIDSMQEDHVDYNKLDTILNNALSKETAETWNERLGKKVLISENLLQASIAYADAHSEYCTDKNGRVVEHYNIRAKEHFIAGANWQKEQMMARAVDGQLENGEDYLRIKCLSTGCQPQDDGKLVKLIIIKEGKQ